MAVQTRGSWLSLTRQVSPPHFFVNPRSERLSITMGVSESDGKLATGNAVNEQANIPEVASSLWLVKLPMLLNVIHASPVVS